MNYISLLEETLNYISLLEATLNESKKYPDITIYFDMDGVLSDFAKMFSDNYGTHIDTWALKDEVLWPMIMKIDKFWENMERVKGSKELWDYAYKIANVEILSGYSRHDKRSIEGKKVWLKKNLSGYNFKTNLVLAKEKQKFADPNSILIDDILNNVNQFKSNGGNTIHFKNPDQAKKELTIILEKLSR
jgi:hypothetical protein